MLNPVAIADCGFLIADFKVENPQSAIRNSDHFSNE